MCDLADDSSVDQLLSILEGSGLLTYFHAAPPCGTCSRARERKIPRRLRRRGAPEPVPLRSTRFPDGLPNLPRGQQRRVDTANRVYRNVARILRWAINKGCIVSIENPTRSHIWSTKYIKALIEDCGLIPITFQQCMWGGQRPKWSTFFTNCDGFQCLVKQCDGLHSHLPWGLSQVDNQWKFNTADEAEYPEPLCEEIADIVAKHAGLPDLQEQIPTSKRPKPNPMAKLRAAEAGRQPRGNLLPQVVPEFKEVRPISWPFSHTPMQGDILSPCQADQLQVPAGSKVLLPQKGKAKARPKKENNERLEREKSIQVGIFHTPEEFTDKAFKVVHPFDSSTTVSDVAKRNMFWLLTHGKDEVRAYREDVFSGYERMASELADREAVLHSHLDPYKQMILKKKRLLLFERMCIDAGVQDEGLTELMVAGVKMTGRGADTGQFPQEERPRTLSDEQLMRSSRWTRRMIMGKPVNFQSDHVRREVWEGALQEVERGWLTGPLEEEDVRQWLGPLFVVSKRFGISQSDKIRSIDDMSESLVNAAYESTYRLDLPGVDGIAVMARTFVEAVSDDRRVQFSLSTGEELCGWLHQSMDVAAGRNLVGRTLDLDAAYKQVPIARGSQWTSVLAVENPEGAKKLFVPHVLPFGASSSVYSFNRLSKALHTIGEKLFGLVWTCYVDDFPQLDLACNGSDSQVTAERMFDLVGWVFSKKDSKRKPMSESFDALGVTFDFSRAVLGEVIVKNKESRLSQIREELDKVRSAGSLSSATASSLRGRLQFAYGRTLSANVRALQRRADGKLAGHIIDDELSAELDWIQHFVSFSKPRVLKAKASKEKVVVFTDAALEGNDQLGTIGLVAYRLFGGKVKERWVFGEIVPPDVLAWLQTRSMKVISSLELMAAWLGLEVCTADQSGVRVFLYVDNEAARASLIAMYSRVNTHNVILKRVSEIAHSRSLFLWTARVPSASNEADAPSRLQDLVRFESKGFTSINVPWHLVRALR